MYFNDTLIQKYGISGPRYTSYPTALQFNDDFTAEEALQRITESDPVKPLSLYFHLPFCRSICYFCGCNKIITNNYGRAEQYIDDLSREIEQKSRLLRGSRQVKQLHWGGGTPTFISSDNMRRLMEITGDKFNLIDDEERDYSVEIDPREVTAEKMSVLKEVGFNRVSFGVQDFNPEVQRAINRWQPERQTLQAVEWASKEGFKSINIDLIYGLPHQTPDSFQKTIEKVMSFKPNRLSVFNYAHIPSMFPAQKRISEEALPSPANKLKMFKQAIEKLTQEGTYTFIGMDHFALPDDELALAQKKKSLHRNFQGYTIYKECELLSMGVSAISNISGCFFQNTKKLHEYEGLVRSDKNPVFRGTNLTQDDHLRSEVIMELICNFYLSIASIEKKFNIKFQEYFNAELENLSVFEEDGLLFRTKESIEVYESGKLLIRNICMVFDAYLKKGNKSYSKVI